LRSILRRLAAVLVVLFGLALWADPAAALPSFAQQTGQACAQCHVGAYGPQLTQYGRDFKLFGYISNDGRNTLPTIAVTATASYTRTEVDRTALPRYRTNDNLAFQSLLLAWAGKVPGDVGVFAETIYDPVRRKLALAKVDVRRALSTSLAGKDLQVGVDVNNRPGVADLWNSTPVFAFSPGTSTFAATPSASTLMDGRLAGRVAGAGAYAMWDNRFYAEATLYRPISNDITRREGLTTAATADVYDDAMPYWRLAMQQEFGDRYVEVGAYGLRAQRYPGGKRTAGQDTLTDTGLDATFQWTAKPHHAFASHFNWTHESIDLDASHVLNATLANDRLDTFRADAIYSYDATWTSGLQWFQTQGSRDTKYFRTANGLPDSTGYVVEVAYAPWGKAKAGPAWANARLNLRWVGYTRFNGKSAGANDNDTLYLGASVALAPFGAFVKR
jgi:hypothetical protein